MRKEIADLVYPVVRYALRLKDQLSRGETPSLQKEQATLKGLLDIRDPREVAKMRNKTVEDLIGRRALGWLGA